jgi:protein-tyrosine phosphatase
MTKILVICTGNINRSALTAALLQRDVGHIHTIRSAGLTADGLVPPDKMVAAALEHGIDLSGHVSRLVTESDIEGADLLICMDRTHPVRLAAVSTEAPTKTFLMTELIESLRGLPDPPDSLEAAIAALADQRSPGQFLSPRHPDVPDPMGRSKRQFKKASQIIVDLVGELSPQLLQKDRE